ncbi:peptide chain release factor N(5)-glutamine methyltransferase [Apirhabdus apintestini]|uniref:peptide chain release factor N(5)-glutamine methyltransferase n=1 Tax=Erwinia sp. HR93 TaxID=3094840 RepID=UPI002ADEF980|nr:peptide chain release factor N(5)-glutamine methyltransferase [Erwinia sp. HR93]MEA1065186.1 peptide chain release factor N(5)-glutamine methyltransferase [Erwinia sp. HR93]WPM85716.1 peptide chain release factor N(5)-glutamine methyltransferase [Enterobacteriaceae bacterium CA-0114]
MDYQSWLRQAAQRLTHSDSPRRDAEILLAHVSGKARTFILAFGETVLKPDDLALLEALLIRREAGEPVAYLTGEREFWSLPLSVSPATLIPRPDTECLVEQALLRLPARPCRILEPGTGTGAIALALASERPDCAILACDRVPEAVALARHNAHKLGLNNVQVIQSDWFSAISQSDFDLVISNPPYIDARDRHLTLGDVRFEPHSALVAAEEGLADLRVLIDEARAYLKSGGWLLLEHGWTQGKAVRALFRQAGYEQVETYRDYGHNERLSIGQFRFQQR